MPISVEVQAQYEHVRTYGPAAAVALSAVRRPGSGADSRLVTERGPMQIGHWKQLRVHLWWRVI
jgi:hypothetical protein